MTPEKLGRYEILGELGKGAMGIVYLARDPLIGRQLAIKTFHLGYSAEDKELEQFYARFLREAQSAGILNHVNIVTIHDVLVDPGGDSFIAMEYVKGTNLKQLMQQHGRLEPAFVVDVVAQIADGLDYAHSKGVVHRDVKPANIILTADKQAKITDFGIARVDTSNLTFEGQLLGTPNYMAPEQIQGKEVDHRADIFSLGVMFYEMVTGEKPFFGENLTAVTHRIVFEDSKPPEEIVAGLPPAIGRILRRALAKDPDERYPRAGEMASDLRAAFAAPGDRPPSGSFLVGPSAEAAPMPEAAPPAGPPPAGPPQAVAPPAVAPPAVAPPAGPPPAVAPPAGPPPTSPWAEPPASTTSTVALHPDDRAAAPSPPWGRLGLIGGGALLLILLALALSRFTGSEPAADERAVSRPPPETLAPDPVAEDAESPVPEDPPVVAPAPPPAAAQPAPSPPPTRVPAPEPVGKATLAIDFHSEVSEGRLTIFSGQERIFQETFKFVGERAGVLRRRQKLSGSLSERLTLPAGAHDLRIYVWRKGAQTRSATVKGELEPGTARTLRIDVSDGGQVRAELR